MSTLFSSRDDLRHRAPEGVRMRDSLFWNLILPEQELGLQVYTFVNHRGRAGYNVCVWGAGVAPIVLQHLGQVGPEADFDDWQLAGLEVRQPELRRTATVRFAGDGVRLDYRFTAVHDAFSYHQNPGGLPPWFAANRFEQAGRVTGVLEVHGRRIEFDHIAHRDHSWGVRDWGAPQHWKWLLAHTPSGAALNAFVWIARGEWGFNGYVLRHGEPVAIAHIDQREEYDDRMDQRRLDAELHLVDGTSTSLTLEAFGAVRMPHDDPFGTVIIEAACHATIDGEPGGGQFETHWPLAYLDHLAAA